MSLTRLVLTVPRKPWRFQAFREARQLISDQSLAAWSRRSAGADRAPPTAADAMPPRGGCPATPRRAAPARAAASSLVGSNAAGPLFARGPKANASGGRG